MKYLVIDVGGTFTKYAIMTEECEFLEKGKFPTVMTGQEAFLDSICSLHEKYKDQVEGIALSMPGFIDSKTGFMYAGGSLFFIKNFNIVEALSKRCHTTVTVGNDAKCAAQAELWKGSLKGCKNAVTVVCGTGVGGAVIVNGKVLQGNDFLAGEFSFLISDNTQPYTLDNLVGFNNGMPAMLRHAAAKKNLPENEVTGEMIFSLANCGDEEMLAVIRQYARGLAIQMMNCQFMTNPEKIAIGGGISEQPLLLSMIKEELEQIRKVFPYDIPVPSLTICRFFNDSNLIGALYVFLEAQTPQLDIQKVEEFVSFIKDRREEKYFMEFLNS